MKNGQKECLFEKDKTTNFSCRHRIYFRYNRGTILFSLYGLFFVPMMIIFIIYKLFKKNKNVQNEQVGNNNIENNNVEKISIEKSDIKNNNIEEYNMKENNKKKKLKNEKKLKLFSPIRYFRYVKIYLTPQVIMLLFIFSTISNVIFGKKITNMKYRGKL